jgi:NarL family two-component system sensor histidine kinase LiaS
MFISAILKLSYTGVLYRTPGKKTMTILEKIKKYMRRLQWKLTFSYATVTLGTLVLTVLILGVLLFTTILAPHELIPPDLWVNIIREQIPPVWRYVLSQTPVDTDLVRLMAKEGFSDESGFQVSHFNLLRVGDLQFTARMMGQANYLIVDNNGVLLGISSTGWVSEDAVGKPLDRNILPGLEGPLTNALSGEVDPDRLFENIIPYEKFYFTFPIFSDPETGQDVLGAVVIYVESIPTESDLASNSANLVIRSMLIFILAVGLIGIIFGYISAKGMSRRLGYITSVTDEWSKGKFEKTLKDSDGDEISQLVDHLNHMSEQLQQLLARSQEIAALEERNRLARDLHDSAKQEAFAASFQIGAALTLIEDDPQKSLNHLHEAENLIDSVRREMTNIIYELRPPSSNSDQFNKTLEEYCLDWAHQTGIHTITKIEGSENFSLESNQSIYRIMQEALSNVARHSSAKNVEVFLKVFKDSVEFSISDDGIGFDPHQYYEGMGLGSMVERTESLGGKLVIQSKPGQGTKVCVTLPNE